MGRFLRLANGVATSFDESSTPTIYDQTFTVGSTITSGTAITLPASGQYTAAELEVYFNGQRVEITDAYNYVGSPPRTQITFTFDLVATDRIRFRVDRGA